MSPAILRLHSFAVRHDSLPAFHASFLALSLLSASLFNLGAFAMLVLAHMTLDVVKYRELHGMNWKRTIEGVIRESLVDMTLLLLGLVFAIYLHHSLPLIAGLSGLLRAEVTIVRAIGTVIPRLVILYDFLKILAHIESYLASIHPRLKKNLTGMELVCITSLGVCFALFATAPLLLSLDAPHFLKILSEELVPWRV
jgi:hypothetical protein